MVHVNEQEQFIKDKSKELADKLYEAEPQMAAQHQLMLSFTVWEKERQLKFIEKVADTTCCPIFIRALTNIMDGGMRFSDIWRLYAEQARHKVISLCMGIATTDNAVCTNAICLDVANKPLVLAAPLHMMLGHKTEMYCDEEP